MKLIELMEDATSILNKFRHNDAKEYGEKMIKVFGNPDEYSDSQLVWRNVSRFKETILKDESIPHNFPGKHRDYVYSSMKINVPDEFAQTLAHTTGSIIVDGLKETVMARCGGLLANAITLQFVKDLIKGKIPNNPEKAKKEYGRRIKDGKSPSWFENKIDK